MGVGGLVELKCAAKSQAGSPPWLIVLLGDGRKGYLPGEGSHPKSSGLDAAQALMNRAGGREVHGTDFVTTGAHSTRGDMMLPCGTGGVCCGNGNLPPKILGLGRMLAWS